LRRTVVKGARQAPSMLVGGVHEHIRQAWFRGRAALFQEFLFTGKRPTVTVKSVGCYSYSRTPVWPPTLLLEELSCRDG
jgi:hypothetical protein